MRVRSTVIPEELEGILVSTEDTLGGSVRFKGTRIPVQALIDTLQRGYGLDYFLDGWPDVSTDQAQAVIDWEQNKARETFGLLAVG